MTITTNPGTTMRLAAVTLLAAGALAACGGGGSTATTSAAAQPTTPSGTRTRGAFGGVDQAQLTKIRDCLTAAGFTIPTPTGTFTRPTGSFTPPASGFPTDRPTGGARGGFFTILQDPKAQAALKACGLTVPTRAPGAGFGGGTGAPTPPTP